MQVESEITIARPRTEVFDHIARALEKLKRQFEGSSPLAG